HAVPLPYTGNYMPSRSDLSFAGLDDFVYKTKVSETETSASKTSKDSLEKPKTVRPSAPIIKEWDTDSDNDSVFRPKTDQTKPKFTKINFVKSDENVKSVNKENTYKQVEYPRKSQSPRGNRRNWNGMMTQKLGNGFEFIKKVCFVCGIFNHLIKDCDFHDNKIVEKPVLNNKGRVTCQREIRPVWNNAQRVNHQNKLTHPHPKRNLVPTAVETKSGQVPANAAKQNSPRAAISISTAKLVNTTAPKSKVNDALPKTYSYFKVHSPVRMAFNQKSAAKTNNLNEKVKTARVNNVNTARPKAIVSAAVGNGENVVKSSACWIWRPTGNVIDHTSKDSGSYMLKRFDNVDLQGRLKHMTGNKSFLTDYLEIDGGFVAFGGSPKGGKITGKGKFRTGKLDFKDVYFVKELKFNLFSVSQMCDKKNSVLFTETECLVLSPDFKLLDESQVLLKVPRQNNMYNLDLKNVVPSGGETLLEVPSKLFENDHTCVACQKGKQHKASCKTKLAEAVSTACYVQNRVLVTKLHNKTPYELLHGRPPSISFMRPFGCPVTILNTLNPLGKFDEKADEGFFVGYSINNKAFRVFNTRTRKVEENLHITFLENKPNVAGSGPDWLFDIDLLTNSMNYEPVTTGNQTNKNAGIKDNVDVVPTQQYILLPLLYDSPQSLEDAVTDDAGKKTNKDPAKENDKSGQGEATKTNSTNRLNTVSSLINTVTSSFTTMDPGRERVQRNEFESVFGQDKDTNGNSIYRMFIPVNAARSTCDNLGRSIPVNAARSTCDNLGRSIPVNAASITPCVLGSFTTLINSLRDINSATQTKRMTKISEELAMVYRNKKDKRGIAVRNKEILVAQGYTQEEGIDYNEVFATVAIIEAIMLFLAYASFIRKALLVYIKLLSGMRPCYLLIGKWIRSGIIEKTVFISSKTKVMQRDDGIFISQDKYVVDILNKFEFVTMKTASTLIETHKALLKDEEAEDVDVHLYKSMIRSLMHLTTSRPDIMFVVCACARDSPFDLEAFSDSDYARASLDRKSTTGGCQFLGKRLISWQYKKQTIVANSTTKAEYVAAANSYGQVGDEAVHKKLGDRMERAATTASSLEAEQDSGNINRTQSIATLMSKFLKEWCRNRIGVDTARHKLNTASINTSENGDMEITATIDGRVKIVTEASIRRHLKLEDFDGISTLPNTKIFEQLALMGPEVKTAAESLVYIRRSASERKDKGKAIMKEAEPVKKKTISCNRSRKNCGIEEAMSLQNSLMKKKGKMSSLNLVTQQRTYMCNYIKNMGSHTLQQLKKFSFDEIKELFETIMKRVKEIVPIESGRLVPKISTGSSKRPVETKLEHEGSKRQKTNEEQSAEEENELSEEEL
ncbi:putative ribonuclease H-like domain-containing protein, partial [Tanacetum coccineum]